MNVDNAVQFTCQKSGEFKNVKLSGKKLKFLKVLTFFLSKLYFNQHSYLNTLLSYNLFFSDLMYVSTGLSKFLAEINYFINERQKMFIRTMQILS